MKTSPIVSYVNRRPPVVGEQIRVVDVESGAEGLASVGEIVTVTMVTQDDGGSRGLSVTVDGVGGVRRFRWVS